MRSWIILMVGLAACGGSVDDEGGGGSTASTTSATGGTNASTGTMGGACANVKGFAALASPFSKCTNCHATVLVGAARNAAPVGVDYDVYEVAKQQAMRPVFKQRLLDFAEPPIGYPTITQAERDDLVEWADCGAPP